jgi:hypothetical protein
VIIVSGCNKEKSNPLMSELSGQWVRVDKPDTLVFGFNGNDNWFELRRGFKLNDDQTYRPVTPFGVYSFKIQDNQIEMHWFASSSSEWPKFSFELKGTVIELGNFIDGIPSIIQLKKTE